jgi:hypothetical protein
VLVNIVVDVPMVASLSSLWEVVVLVLMVLVVWSVGLDEGGELARFEGIIIVVVEFVIEGRSISVIHFGCVWRVCVVLRFASSSSSSSSVCDGLCENGW